MKSNALSLALADVVQTDCQMLIMHLARNLKHVSSSIGAGVDFIMAKIGIADLCCCPVSSEGATKHVCVKSIRQFIKSINVSFST